MSKVGVQKAANLSGKSKSSIQRDMKSGKLSYEVNEKGIRSIDLSELERVYGNITESAQKTASVKTAKDSASNDFALQAKLEVEKLKMEIRLLEEKLHITENVVDDLKEQRDQWQKQAQQVLITSQYSQKQAEDLREELRQKAMEDENRRLRALDKKRRLLLEQRQAQQKAQEEQMRQQAISNNDNYAEDDYYDEQAYAEDGYVDQDHAHHSGPLQYRSLLDRFKNTLTRNKKNAA
jgi:hypothetical protein